MLARLASWFNERVPIDVEQLRDFTNEPVPNHIKHWWFALGGTPAYLFMVQVVTGIALAVYYQPSQQTAYESVRYITDEAVFGWYLRSVHRWGATLMIAAVILHQIRVFFTGAYRAPRELSWVVGMGLLACSLLLGFTGYSLVYEQLSYWGATVGANIGASVPIVGNLSKELLLGGEAYNDHTLPRFFVLHAAVLPGLMVVLIGIHITLIRIQGVTEFHFASDADKPRRHFDFFPDHILTELMIGLILMIVLSALATIFPATLGPKADPLTTPEVIKPEWFFYVAFRWLKLFSGTFAVISTGFIVFTMFAWPFIDAQIRKHTKYQEASVWIGIVAALTIIAMTVWEGLVAH